MVITVTYYSYMLITQGFFKVVTVQVLENDNLRKSFK